MKSVVLAFAAAALSLSCQSAPPAGASSTATAGTAGGNGGAGAFGGGGHGGGGPGATGSGGQSSGALAGALACEPPEVPFPPPFHPMTSCCGDRGACNGRCILGKTGNGEERKPMCNCGTVTFDGQAHHGPPPCADGQECCVMPLGNNVCVREGECFNCAPAKSSKWVIANCCAAKTPCRGGCGLEGMGPCSCAQPGDGGCAEGTECCFNPLTQEYTCLPWGECQVDPGPCPPLASSPAVAVDCCHEWPCRGRCEAVPHTPGVCLCGASNGCQLDEECCLGPSGKNDDPATACVPVGQCPSAK